MNGRIIHGDALKELAKLPDESVDCCITSPPYWALRAYSTNPQIWDGKKGCEHEWNNFREEKQLSTGMGERRQKELGKDTKLGNKDNNLVMEYSFCSKCGAWRGELGLEPNFDLFIKHLCDIYDQVKRVLKKSGTCWVNLGDTYYGGGKGETEGINKAGGIEKVWKRPSRDEYKKASVSKECLYCKKLIKGKPNSQFCSRECLNKMGNDFRSQNRLLPNKSLCLIPHRFAIEMVNRGWILRNTIIWHKPNCMPSSAKDRFTVDFEYVFFFVKNKRYFFEAQREGDNYYKTTAKPETKRFGGDAVVGPKAVREERIIETIGRNKRCVWTICPQPFSEAHFACVDEETECLTNRGWKKYDEIKIGDWICSYNMKTKELEWDNIQHIYSMDATETDMVKVQTRDIDMLLTKDHRTVVRNYRGELKERIIQADNLKTIHKIPTAARFWADEVESFFKYPKLAGLFITDGWISNGRCFIEQYKPKGKEYLRFLANSLDFVKLYKRNHKEKKGLCLAINKECSEALIKLFEHRRKPSWKLMDYPEFWLQELFEGMVLGDGNIRKDGRISFVKTKEIVDLFQAICIRLGLTCRVSQRKDKLKIWCAFVTKKKDVSLRGTNAKGKTIEIVKYKGVVWCPKTQNSTWLARRNGKPFITGNTFPEVLVEPMIKSGCPQFVCKKCGKPREKIYQEIQHEPKETYLGEAKKDYDSANAQNPSDTKRRVLLAMSKERKPIGFSSCSCNAGFDPGVVLDPFLGSGTTALVAEKLNRRWLGIELQEDYIRIAEKRLEPYKNQERLTEVLE